MTLQTSNPRSSAVDCAGPVAFIGLGRMGWPMAANLVRSGVDVRVWNRSAEKARAFVAEVGGAAAESPLEAARGCRCVVTMVADGDVLEAVLFGVGGAADGLVPGGYVVDMSTIGAAAARTLAARLAERGLRFVDAPVSGSVAAASAASLTIMAGATAADFAAVEPLLARMGEPVLHVGGPGQAALVKLAINHLIYGINQCVAEALLLAERGGIDRAAAYDAFLQSAAAAPMLHYRREQYLRPGSEAVSLTLALAEKDLRLIIELAEEFGADLPQARVNRAVAQAAIAAGLGDNDVAVVARYLREDVRLTTSP